MHDTTTPTGKSHTIALQGSWTIERALELKNMLLAAAGDAQDVVIATEELTEMDLACLQVLCAAHQTFAQQDRAFGLNASRSAAFKKVVREAGYARDRGCRHNFSQSCLWKGDWA